MPHTVLLLALEPSLPAQMVQVGDALAHGKPLLGQGKVVPAPGADVPGHMGGGFIGGACRGGCGNLRSRASSGSAGAGRSRKSKDCTDRIVKARGGAAFKNLG